MAQKQKPVAPKPSAKKASPTIQKSHIKPVIEDTMDDIDQALEQAKEDRSGCGCGGSLW